MFKFEHFNRFVSFVFDPNTIETPACVGLLIPGAHVNKNNRIERANGHPATYCGWFNRSSRLADAARRLTNASAYASVNPVCRCKLAEDANDVRRVNKGEGTCAKDIVSINYLLIDIDVRRPADVSSTRGELEGALELRGLILEKLPELCVDSIHGCSGNGGYIVCRIGPLPNTPENVATVRRILRSLAEDFGKAGRDPVYVDVTSPAKPTVHLALPGTLKCQGEDTEERPHRIVTVEE
jgi:hypothetical protein